MILSKICSNFGLAYQIHLHSSGSGLVMFTGTRINARLSPCLCVQSAHIAYKPILIVRRHLLGPTPVRVH